MAGEKITKVYDLQELGGEHVIQVLEQINLEFAAIKKSKQALNKESIKASFDGDTEAVNKLKVQFEELRLKELQVEIQKQELINQAKQDQLIRQQELANQRKIAAGNESVAGSYNDIAQQYRKLLQVTKNGISLGDSLNIKDAQEKLKALKVQLDSFNRGLSPDGTLIGEYKTGILNAFKDAGLTDLIQGQLTQAKGKVRDLNTEFDKLKSELRAVQSTGQGSLDTLEKQLLENRAAAGKLNEQIKSLENGIRGTSVGTQIVDGLKQSFKDLGKQVVQVALGYIGLQAALSGIRKETGIAEELSDQTTSLEIELGKVKGGADKLVKSLAEIDTRTKLTGLEEIANIAAKAGVSEENLVGVSEAIDKIKIAFGKDFGDVEKGTEDLVKLINVFLGTDAVTGDNLLKTGNAVRTLANESIASVPFLNDFATRMAGLRGISDITLPSVLGLASGFEQFGQSAEVSSTALVKIIPKLATDTKKYGEIAGLTQKQFSYLLNTRPEEALLRVAEGLTKGKAGIEEISQAFADSELGKGRITAILGVLGKKADDFRVSIDSANKSFQDTSNIEDAFAAKNNNLAATMDKLSKAFADAANSKTFQFTLLAISSAILLIINNLPTVITLVGLWAAGWAVANKELVIQNARLLLLNTQIIASRIALGALTIAQTAYTAVMGLFTGATTLATTATNLFRAALMSLPFGWILAIVGAVTAGFVALGTAVFASTGQLKDHARASQLNGEIQEEVNKATAGTIAKMAALTSVIKDNNVSLAARKLALEQLIAISPEYLGKLTLENIKTAEGVKIIQDYTKALKDKAQAQAIDAGLTKAQEKLLEAQKNEARAASDPEYAKEEYSKLTDNPFFNSVIDAVKFGTLNSEQAYIKYYYQELQKEAQKDIDYYTKAIGGQIEDSTKKIADSKKKQSAIVFEVDIPTLKNRSKELQDQIDAFQGSREDLQKLNDEKEGIDKQLQELMGKKGKDKVYGGAKLTGETKDSLKEVEAETSLLLTELEKRKTLGTITEAEYYTELNKITQDGISKKLAVIKNGNAEEKKQRADLELESIKSTQETNKKLYDLGEKSAKQDLDSAKSLAENKLKLVTENANSTELQKAEAQLQYDNEALNAQITFNEAIDQLEKVYGIRSLENIQKRNDDRLEADRKVESQRIAVAKAAAQEREKLITDTVSIELDNEDAEYFAKQKAIFETTYLTKQAQNRALEELEREHQASMLGKQKAGLIAMQNEIIMQGKAGTITWQEYQKRIAEINKQIAQNNRDTADQTNESIESTREHTIRTLEEISNALQKVASVFSAYAEMQNQKIQNEQDATDAQIDADKEKALSTATTEEEKQAVEDKYKKIKTDNDKKYAEQRRAIALRELEIQSALAALVAYTDGLKAGGPAGPWVGAGYVALVGAIYLLNRQKIMAQKFEKGGKLKSTLGYGGIFDGPSHANGGIPISNYEVEGKEGYVINKKSMASTKRATVTGTPAQIASVANVMGGGVDFAPGASRFLFDYGGNLGMNLKAPVIAPRPYINTPASKDDSEVLNTLKAQADAIAAMSNQILTLQVQLNPNSVTSYQEKKAKAVKIATL